MHIIYRYCHPWQDAEKYFQEVSSMICLIDICSISGFPLVVTALQSAQASTTASCCLALIGFDGILGFIMISWMKHMNGTYIHSIYIHVYMYVFYNIWSCLKMGYTHQMFFFQPGLSTTEQFKYSMFQCKIYFWCFDCLKCSIHPFPLKINSIGLNRVNHRI